MKKREREAVSVRQGYAVLDSKVETQAEEESYTQHRQTGYNLSIDLYDTHAESSRRGKSRPTRGEGERARSSGVGRVGM